jgi:hypothetical protein
MSKENDKYNLRLTLNLSSETDADFHHETSFYSANLNGKSLIEMEKDLLALLHRWLEVSQ